MLQQCYRFLFRPHVILCNIIYIKVTCAKMSYGGDEFTYGDERYPPFSDLAVRPLSERVQARRAGVNIADGVARGYGPLNVRQTSRPENMAMYDMQGVNSQYRYGHHESPLPYQQEMRRDDIDMRSMKMDQEWEATCKMPNRPAMTIGKYSEAFAGGLPERAMMNPDMIMLFLILILLIVVAQCMRSMWGLSERVDKLKDRVASLERSVR